MVRGSEGDIMTHSLLSKIGSILVGALLVLPKLSVTAAMADYEQPRSVMDAAGGRTSSSGYLNISVMAQPSPPGISSGAGFRNHSGFLHSVAAAGYLLPDYTIALSFLGAGSGIVSSTPAGIQCNTGCSGVFNSYFPVLLSPVAAPYMVFTGWGGGCSGTGDCTIHLTGDVSVTATFEDLGHSVYIPGGPPGTGYYSTLQEAYNGAPTDATIWAWDISYVENLECGQDKGVKIKGGYDTGYGAQLGMTTLEGTLTIRRGSLTVERLVVK
jgi:hypothetical protein